MPLDDKRQALLDVFCHCYEKLLDYLDTLEEAAQAHPEWSNYRIVKECFNPAAKAFGSAEVKTLDLSTLCSDFLSRAEGFIVGKLSADSPVVVVFAEYKAAVQASPVLTQVDLTSWQRLGEELSKEYYQELLQPIVRILLERSSPFALSLLGNRMFGVYLKKMREKAR